MIRTVPQFFQQHELDELKNTLSLTLVNGKRINFGTVVPGVFEENDDILNTKCLKKVSDYLQNSGEFEITPHSDYHLNTFVFPHDDFSHYEVSSKAKSAGKIIKAAIYLGEVGAEVKNPTQLLMRSFIFGSSIKVGDLLVFNPSLKHFGGFRNGLQAVFFKLLNKLNGNLMIMLHRKIFPEERNVLFFTARQMDGDDKLNKEIDSFIQQNIDRQNKQKLLVG